MAPGQNEVCPPLPPVPAAVRIVTPNIRASPMVSSWARPIPLREIRADGRNPAVLPLHLIGWSRASEPHLKFMRPERPVFPAAAEDTWLNTIWQSSAAVRGATTPRFAPSNGD